MECDPFCRSSLCRCYGRLNTERHVRRNTMVLLPARSDAHRPDDFRMTFSVRCAGPFAEAAFRLEPSFFHALRVSVDLHRPRVVGGCDRFEMTYAIPTVTTAATCFFFLLRSSKPSEEPLAEFRQRCNAARTPGNSRTRRRPRGKQLFHRFVTLFQAHSSRGASVALHR